MSEMIPDPESYFRGFVPERDALLLELEREARREEIPLVGPVVGRLLSILVQATGAASILELGTATGYSAIFLARAARAFDGRVVTVEFDEEMARRAGNNFRRAGLEERVEVRIGPASDLLATMREIFDLIFLDIDKEHYLEALPHCRRLLRPAGLLVADNTGFEASREFNDALRADAGWESVQLLSFLPEHSPEQDGLCLAVRLADRP